MKLYVICFNVVLVIMLFFVGCSNVFNSGFIDYQGVLFSIEENFVFVFKDVGKNSMMFQGDVEFGDEGVLFVNWVFDIVEMLIEFLLDYVVNEVQLVDINDDIMVVYKFILKIFCEWEEEFVECDDFFSKYEVVVTFKKIVEMF